MPPARLSFPLTLTHADRPDYTLATANGPIGIEHTEAIQQSEAWAEDLRAQGHGPNEHFIRHARPSEPLKPRQTMIDELEVDEAGDGWTSRTAEDEWVKFLTEAVEKKLSTVRKPGYTKHPDSWIAVYNNLSLPPVDPLKATPRLQAELERIEAFTAFNSIFVDDGSRIVEFRIDRAPAALG